MSAINVNGRISGAPDAVIPVLDHGFLYGEGVYETLRTYGHRPFLYARHARRLRRSASMIALELPFSDADLLSRIRATMDAAALGSAGAGSAGAGSAGAGGAGVGSAGVGGAGAGSGEAYIRVLVTRGIGELTYDIKATPTPSLVIIVKPQVDPPAEVYRAGVSAVIVSIVRNHPDTVNPMIKSNNLMNSALAMQEAYRRGAFEGVMRNYRGELAECTTSNLFIVKDGVALTPPLDAGLLPGITREFLMEIGKDVGVEVGEQVLHDADLFGADEAFLTSTTREAVPITRVDDRIIGAGRPGPVTARLLEEFRRRTRAE